MKNYVFLLVTIFLFASCQKEAEAMGDAYPKLYYLYFQVMDKNGESYKGDPIEISHCYIIENNSLELYHIEEELWRKLKIMDSLRNENLNLFGVASMDPNDDAAYPILFETGERARIVMQGRTEEVMDWYYLFRNSTDHTKIDTLRIRDVVRIEPYSRTFDFFLNEEPLEVQGDGKFQEDNPNYISIQLK